MVQFLQTEAAMSCFLGIKFHTGLAMQWSLGPSYLLSRVVRISYTQFMTYASRRKCLPTVHRPLNCVNSAQDWRREGSARLKSKKGKRVSTHGAKRTFAISSSKSLGRSGPEPRSTFSATLLRRGKTCALNFAQFKVPNHCAGGTRFG